MGNLIKIDKYYTIRYSKSGIYQYADFRYTEDGKLVNHDFRPTYVKQNEIPSLEGLNDIQQILEVIKAFSYCNTAEIYLINGLLPEIYNNETVHDSLKNSEIKYDDFIGRISFDFFMSELLPYIQKNDWKITFSWCAYPCILKKENDEWIDIDSHYRDYVLMNFICNKFINRVLRANEKLDLTSQSGYSSIGESMNIFFRNITKESLVHLGLYITEEELNKASAPASSK